MLAKLIPMACPNDELMVGVTAPSRTFRERLHGRLKFEGQSAEFGSIVLGDVPSPKQPRIKVRQFLQQDCSLQGIQTKVSTHDLVEIFRFHSVIADDFKTRS